MKNIKKKTYILFFITLIVLYFVLKDDFSNILNGLLNLNVFWIFIAIFCMFIYWCAKTNCVYFLAKKHQNKLLWKDVLKQTGITQFFCGVTPFSTGGEPMAIYMLNKSGLKIEHASSIILQNFILYQIVLIIYGIIAVILNSIFNIFSTNVLLNKIVILGFIINILVAVFLLLLAFSKKISYALLNFIINVGSKIKLIKDKTKQKEIYSEKLDEFHSCAKMFKKNKFLFIKLLFNNFIGMTSYYLIPYFVILSTGLYTNISFIDSIVCTAHVMIVANFIPIPGASGGIEYGFLQFYGNFITGPILSTILIIWRFISYYLEIIIGGIILNIKGVDFK